MLLMMGVLQALEGLAAIVHGDFFASDSRYAYALDITAWGWGHLLLGLIAAAVGVGVLAGMSAAAYVAIVVAFVAAVANLLFIPYYLLSSPTTRSGRSCSWPSTSQ
jgi:Flp pilus assembly protein TadB